MADMLYRIASIDDISYKCYRCILRLGIPAQSFSLSIRSPLGCRHTGNSWYAAACQQICLADA